MKFGVFGSLYGLDQDPEEGGERLWPVSPMSM